MEESQSNGLVKGHSYAITSVRQLKLKAEHKELSAYADGEILLMIRYQSTARRGLGEGGLVGETAKPVGREGVDGPVVGRGAGVGGGDGGPAPGPRPRLQ